VTIKLGAEVSGVARPFTVNAGLGDIFVVHETGSGFVDIGIGVASILFLNVPAVTLGGSGGTVGFFGGNRTTKPTITGSRASTAALASLLTALAAMNLLVDSSTT
jgi:hypothetical protein